MLKEPSRHLFVDMVKGSASILEIGPFTNPVCTGKNVRYFDVLDKPSLIRRAEQIGRPIDRAVDIDFVSPVGDLSVVDEKFDACISSHAIEHQPDLIKHLIDVERILNPGGRYFLIIPDKRYCFDHFIPESSIADILEARGSVTHTLQNIIEHRALTTHNDVKRHWRGDHGRPRYIEDPIVVKRAMDEFHNAKGSYIDVHAWQFTPNSFRQNIDTICQLGIIRMRVEVIFQTAFESVEFYAVLRLE